MSTEDDLRQTIITATAAPSEVTTEQGTVKSRPLTELIEADKHLSSKSASRGSKTRGVHYAKFILPGTNL